MKTIIWDVDDVLNDLLRSWFAAAWLPAHPRCAVTYDQLRENPPHAVLGISLPEYLASIDAFRCEAGARLEPDPAALAWFRQHGHRFHHSVLTLVPLRAADTWAAWTVRHFGRWVRSFHFIPSRREGENLPVFDRTKAELLARWPRVDAIVEDNAATLEAARQLGIRAVTVPRPWNGGREAFSDQLRALAELG